MRRHCMPILHHLADLICLASRRFRFSDSPYNKLSFRSSSRQFSARKVIVKPQRVTTTKTKMSSPPRKQLLDEIAKPVHSGHTKVTVVGSGQVGMACAFSLLTQGHVTELALVDVLADKLKGEMMDLKHAMAYMDHVHIEASTDYSITANSRICIVTAGSRQREGEDRLALLQRNASIFKGIIPQLIKHSPDCILLIVSNPVDIMTWMAWKISGLPVERVFGSGTSLDTSRFRQMLGETLEISAGSVHAYIVGEHGDSSVAVWSTANVGGIRFRDLDPNVGAAYEHQFGDMHQKVTQAAYEIIKLKGYTNWAIGLCVSYLCSLILKNQNVVVPVSTLARGRQGIEHEIFLSLPCRIGENGVNAVLNLKLNDDEKKKLMTSVETLHTAQKDVKLE